MRYKIKVSDAAAKEALLKLLEEEGTREHLGGIGYQEAENFDIRKISEHYHNLFCG